MKGLSLSELSYCISGIFYLCSYMTSSVGAVMGTYDSGLRFFFFLEYIPETYFIKLRCVTFINNTKKQKLP